MVKSFGWAVSAIVLSLSVSACVEAQVSFTSAGERSAFHDASNLGGAHLGYGISVDKSADQADFRINNVQFTPSNDWDAGIDLQTVSGSFLYNDRNDLNNEKTYTFGDLITGASSWNVGNVAFRDGAVAAGVAGVATGLYHGTLDIVGGADTSFHGCALDARHYHSSCG